MPGLLCLAIDSLRPFGEASDSLATTIWTRSCTCYATKSSFPDDRGSSTPPVAQATRCAPRISHEADTHRSSTDPRICFHLCHSPGHLRCGDVGCPAANAVSDL